MTKVICAEDCGNAPRKLLLKDLSVAFADGDVGALLDLIADDVVLNIIGDRRTVGRDGFRDAILENGRRKAKELHLHNIITHGATGAVNGTLKMDDNRWVEYCDVFVFSGAGIKAKIKEITSYRIDIGNR